LSYPSSSTSASVKSLTKVSDIVFDILAFIFLDSSSNSLIIGSIGGVTLFFLNPVITFFINSEVLPFFPKDLTLKVKVNSPFSSLGNNSNSTISYFLVSKFVFKSSFLNSDALIVVTSFLLSTFKFSMAFDKPSLQLIAAKGRVISGKDARYLSMFFLIFIYTFRFIFSL